MPTSKLRPAIARLQRVPGRLLDAVRPRSGCLTLVHASAGYGKTTALAGAHEPGSTWYNLDATDRDTAVFALRLSTAMGLRAPTQAVATVEGLALELAQQLQGRPTTLTLDRWERLGDAADLGHLLEELILLTPGLALRMATRARPSLPLARMRLDGRLIDLGPGELRLDRSEIVDLLTAARERPPRPAEIDFADSVLAGWPAAIQLWLTGQGSASPTAPLVPGHLLHEYFHEQVLGALPDDVRALVGREWRWMVGHGPLVERASNPRRRALAERLVRDRVAVEPGPDGWRAHPVMAAIGKTRGGRPRDAGASRALAALDRRPSPGIGTGCRVRIRTFGGLTVLVDGQALPDTTWPASSRRLLELLLSQPRCQTTAEEASLLLWPRHPARAARNSFNVALHSLRRALEPGLASGVRSSYVIRDGREYRLCIEHVTCDVEEFTRLVRDVPSPPDEAGRRSLRAAMELHRGDFLASSGEPFVAARRAELRALLLTCAQRLGHWSPSDNGDVASAG